MSDVESWAKPPATTRPTTDGETTRPGRYGPGLPRIGQPGDPQPQVLLARRAVGSVKTSMKRSHHMIAPGRMVHVKEARTRRPCGLWVRAGAGLTRPTEPRELAPGCVLGPRQRLRRWRGQAG